MHLFDPATHFSCSGIIAEGLSAGPRSGARVPPTGTDRVAVAVTGEGAANQGAFHESLNLAALWQLPVVFVVEDNDWGISVPRNVSTSVPSNAERAAGYGMPGVRIEDNAVEAVHEAAGVAVDRARAGGGPSLIEVHTLRLWGHFEGDAQGYRSDRGRCARQGPVARLRNRPPRGRRTRRTRGGASEARRGQARGGRDRLREGQPGARPGVRPRPRVRLTNGAAMTSTDTSVPSAPSGRKLSTAQAMVEAISAEMDRDQNGLRARRGRRSLRRDLQLDRPDCWRGSARNGSWTPRSRRPRSSAPRSARRPRACARSSS